MGFIPEERIEGTRLKSEKPNYFAYWTTAVIVGIIVAILLKQFLVKGYYVTTENMKHSLYPGDVALVRKMNPQQIADRSSIICFVYPAETSQYRFGRVVGRGLDIVEIVNKKLFVNGRSVDLPPGAFFADSKIEDDPFSLRDNFGPFTVPEGHYFVLGDNRDRAIDSRSFGTVPYSYVLGRPMRIFLGWKLDPRAPKVTGLMDIFDVVIYNISNFMNRLDLSRLGKSVR